MPLSAKEKVSMFCQVDKEQVADYLFLVIIDPFVSPSGDLCIGREDSLSRATVTGRESRVHLFINPPQSDPSS